MSNHEPCINLLRKIVIDGLLICILVFFIVYSEHTWEPFQRGFFCGDKDLMYPFKEDTVSVRNYRSVGLTLNIVAFLLCEWALLRKERSEVRCLGMRIAAWIRGFYSALASFGFGLCFSEILTNISKLVLGRLRPYFFEICKPTIDCNALEWQNRYIHPDEFTCTGDNIGEIRNAHMSFVSGHSSWAAYTMIFFALYLERRMTWQGTRTIRHVLQYIALVLSAFTAFTRVSDYRHHWSDVIAGFTLGASLAVLMIYSGTDWVEKKKGNEAEPIQPIQDIPFTIAKPTST